MQEQRNYILHTLKTLLHLEEAPYELANSPHLDKFVSSDQEQLLLHALPSKEFKIITSPTAPTEGSVITISKFKGDSSLKNFYNVSIRPAQGYKQLEKQITHLY